MRPLVERDNNSSALSILCLELADTADIKVLRESAEVLGHHHENVASNATVTNRLKAAAELNPSTHKREWASELKKARYACPLGLCHAFGPCAARCS